MVCMASSLLAINLRAAPGGTGGTSASAQASGEHSSLVAKAAGKAASGKCNNLVVKAASVKAASGKCTVVKAASGKRTVWSRKRSGESGEWQAHGLVVKAAQAQNRASNMRNLMKAESCEATCVTMLPPPRPA